MELQFPENQPMGVYVCSVCGHVEEDLGALLPNEDQMQKFPGGQPSVSSPTGDFVAKKGMKKGQP